MRFEGTDKPSFVNDYDHFTYDENRFEGIGVSVRTNRSAINLCKGETYKDKFKKYRETVSDHTPISMDIDLRNERLYIIKVQSENTRK